MLHMTKILSSPTSKPPRVSVPVSPEALDAFQRLGKASNMSTGRAIAEWLDDTIEAANFMALNMEKARLAPKQAMSQLHAYAFGMAEETGDLLAKIKAKAEGSADAPTVGKRSAAGGGLPIPPSCNTGGKVPKAKGPQRGGKSS